MSQIVCFKDINPDFKFELLEKLTFAPEEKGRKQFVKTDVNSVQCYVMDNELGIEVINRKKIPEDEKYKRIQELKKEGSAECLRIPFQKAVTEFGTTNDECELTRINITKQEGAELRKEQKELGKKIVADLRTKRSATLCLRAGGGKTAITCVLTTCIKLLTCVFVQNKILLEQWKTEFEKFTTARVCIVGKDTDFNIEYDAYVCYIGRYHLIPRKIRDKVGFMVIDESPLLCNKPGVNAMLSLTPKYMLACSATPSRSRDNMYVVMDAFYGTHHVKHKPKREMTVTRYLTHFEGDKIKRGGRLSWSDYIQSILYNQERNELIVNAIIEDWANTTQKIMVVTTEKKHVMLLYDMIKEADISVDYLTGSKKSYSNCEILVGNIQKCGVGFDDANFCKDFDGRRISIVWIVSEIANPEMAEQVVGRARAKSPLIRQVVDNDSLSQKHWQVCMKTYKQNGATIVYKKLIPN